MRKSRSLIQANGMHSPAQMTGENDDTNKTDKVGPRVVRSQPRISSTIYPICTRTVFHMSICCNQNVLKTKLSEVPIMKFWRQVRRDIFLQPEEVFTQLSPVISCAVHDT